ncbi:hypothetical protein ACFY5D_21235 [Paeniglutamicibacter sp. NPDC012692]|uniref:hypothetical protein n=1 Tax=Paeniglutamicibacter sp. NPDC012692 TaxID=3364388 RepID=UPI0036CC4FF0
MAEDQTGVNLPATKVSVQVSTDAPKGAPAKASKAAAKAAFSVSEGSDETVDPTPIDPPEPVDPTKAPMGPTTPPVKPTTPPVTPNPKPGTVKPAAPNRPNPGGVKQPESIRKNTTPLQPNGVTKGGAIKTPVKHAQRVAVKTPSGAIQRAMIPAGTTSVTPYIPDNAVLVDTGLGAQSAADKDIEFWSIIAGITLLAGAGAGMVVTLRGRGAKAQTNIGGGWDSKVNWPSSFME